MALLGFSPANETSASLSNDNNKDLCLSPHVVVSNDAKAFSDTALEAYSACDDDSTEGTRISMAAPLPLSDEDDSQPTVLATPSPRAEQQVVRVLATETIDESTQCRVDVDERAEAAARIAANEQALAAALAENERLKQRLIAMHSLITGGLHHVLQEADKISPPPSQAATPRAGHGVPARLNPAPGTCDGVESFSSWQARLLALVRRPALGISTGIGSVATYVRWPRSRLAHFCAATLAATGIYCGLRYTGRIDKISLSKVLLRLRGGTGAPTNTPSAVGAHVDAAYSSPGSALMTAASVVEAGVKQTFGHLKFSHQGLRMEHEL